MQPPPPAPDADNELVPISALQHYLFCPRQCALMHLEGIWLENEATVEGRLMHERVDGGRSDRRGGISIVRGLILRSLTYKLSGKADAVEFHGRTPRPIEYKRGRPKSHRADEVQLCAQALCLEEMFSCLVSEGAIYYGQTRKRLAVTFDAELRSLTLRVAADYRQMIAVGETPPPHKKPECRRCSLIDACLPDELENPPVVQRWLVRQLADW